MNVNRREFVAGSAAALAALKMPKLVAQGGGQEFVLTAPIMNPFFAWPRTLLSYPASGAVQSLNCVETGKTIPVQMSGKELLFFSDLPSGATRTFKPGSGAAAMDGPQVTVTKEAARYTIDAGPLQVRIPATQAGGANVPGPILEVSRGAGKWTGGSTFKLPGLSVASITTEQLEDGPLRSTHRITYALSNGAKYVATVQCAAGMDFVRLHEDMETLPQAPLGEFTFAWTGCEFQFRQSPDHPYTFPRQIAAKYTDYPWEQIAPVHMDTQFGVSGGLNAGNRMPFALRLFDPWADQVAASYASFWSNDGPDAASIFIDHMEQCEDHEYAIWHSSPRLAVEFVYNKPELSFVYKLGRGSRSTCLSFYDHARDIAAMQLVEAQSKGVVIDRVKFANGIFPTSHSHYMQQWHGSMSLDKTKDWVVTRPASAMQARPLFKVSPYKTVGQFYGAVMAGEFTNNMATSGTRQNHGFGPTSSRQVQESWLPAYQMFYSQMTPEQRRAIEGVYLSMAYMHAGEDYMPMQRMLAGHPNFLADVKSVPASIGYLFPDHPATDTWADEYEAYLKLNSRYHTRPEVTAWNAKGGRWTENLGTYVWAFVRPSLRAATLLKERDGIQRFCTPQVAQVGDWLVNALSAPFAGESAAVEAYVKADAEKNEGNRRHYWGIVFKSEGPRRLHPPQGAHSERRKTPRSLYHMGLALRNYRPLTAEHIMWASRPTDMDMEAPVELNDAFGFMSSAPDNRGTNPHLRTSKYTGYGITLRAAVDTPQELSVHLLQIDDGPNYRWGDNSEGGCGTIYFYANGKGYSHNGGEDVGDRIDQDTDFGSNFGVWKGNTFRAIGENVLSRPLYDLGVGQFAEIVPRDGENAYSWPEYVSRNLMLAGDDYFLVWDRVFNAQIAHRFSWFVRKGDDFPHITMLTGRGSREGGLFTTVETEVTSGRWVDGSGDSLAVITHKEGITAVGTAFGGRVQLASGGTDLLFAAAKEMEVMEAGYEFAGTAGLIRTRTDGVEMALFHGSRIAVGGLTISTVDKDLGISAVMAKSGSIAGRYFAPAASEVEFGVGSERLGLYVDGERAGSRNGAMITAKLAAGEHRWELAAGLPVPMAPRVEYTEYLRGGAVVYGAAVAGAASYSAELSKDNGATWAAIAGTSATPKITVNGLAAGSKVHVRLIAANAEHKSEAGPEYPVYCTDAAPDAPDGLHVALAQGAATLTWGEVLGVSSYKLYRKGKGEAGFKVVYSGREHEWMDKDGGIVPPAASPSPSGLRASAPVAEYYVTAVNQLGESRASRHESTDPTSWRNWNPTGTERFRRTVELTEGRLPNDGGGRYYPG